LIYFKSFLIIMITVFFVLNSKGDVLLSRSYRGEEISRGITTAFRIQVLGSKEARNPVNIITNYSFIHVRHESLFFVALTKLNANVSVVFETIYKIIELFKAYFGGIDEESLRSHISLAHELLDEMVDYGYPQNLSLEAIKPFIFQKGSIKPEKLKQDKINKITVIATGAIPWRSPDIKYKKNEIYIDVIESVNLLMSVDGKVLHANVSGSIMMKCYLSGLPECKFGLNDKLLMDKEAKVGTRAKTNGIEIDDFTFHQCVRLGKFDSDRTISFVPPDGEFELMKYRTTENITVPFRVLPIVKEHSRTRIEIKLTVKSNFKKDSIFGTGVKVKIPVPKNTATCRIYSQNGKAKYTPEVGAIVWKIRRFPAETEYTLGAEVELSSSVSLEKKQWSRPPISMEFQVPMFTSSDLQVRFLKVLEQKQQYETIKWVRYLTQAGNYHFRI